MARKSMKIIWINGTFGVGKTTVSNVIVDKINNAFLLEFDDLQMKYKPKSIFDVLGDRYPEARRYLIDALVSEILEIIQQGQYDYLIIPIALINDYCREKLVNGLANIDSYHFILKASNDILQERIFNQENRDVDLAITYMDIANDYLRNHYSEAYRIDTTNKTIDSIADEIVEIIVVQDLV